VGTVVTVLPDLSVADFTPHALHAPGRTWTETNCYVDVWIEVLAALGLDPVAATAFTLSCDFEGDQWTFSKFPPEDLRALFGLEVAEINVWRSVADHVAEQLDLGRLCTVECDSWFLPDTRGVAYRIEHVKTTIVPVRLDRPARRLAYFHNAGFFEVGGDDVDGLFRTGDHADPSALAPYVESIRLDRLHRADPGPVATAAGLARGHLARRPADNPVRRMAVRVQDDLGWLATQDLDVFHRYAFGLCRQCGASAELAATFVDWLGANGGPRAASAADSLRAVAEGAKTLQFALARVVRGRTVDPSGVLDGMAEQWDRAMDSLVTHYGA
jgi:hypothetical protein